MSQMTNSDLLYLYIYVTFKQYLSSIFYHLGVCLYIVIWFRRDTSAWQRYIESKWTACSMWEPLYSQHISITERISLLKIAIQPWHDIWSGHLILHGNDNNISILYQITLLGPKYDFSITTAAAGHSDLSWQLKY